MNEEEDFLKQVEKTGVQVYNSVMQIGDGSPTDSGRGGRGLGSGEWGRRLLSLARAGDALGVARLAAAGAPLACDWLGAGPLHAAARAGHAAAAEALLRAGAHKDARTKLDRTPLHFAAYHSHLDVLKVLLDFGANVDPRDMLGMTPLHWAAEQGCGAAAGALLRAGGDPQLRSKFLKTPLQLASKRPELLQQMMDIIAERESRAATSAFGVEEEPEPQIEAIPINLNKSQTLGDQDNKDRTFKIEEGSGAAVLMAHGITLLPADSGGGTAASALRAGRSVVLSDAGRLLLSESAEATRSPQPVKVQIKKNIKITGIKRSAVAMENTVVTSTTGTNPISQNTLPDPTGDSPEVSDIDDVTDSKSPAVKIIMNRANFNKLVATATRVHSPEKQEDGSVRVRVVPGGERVVAVPGRFIRSRDPQYLRSQLLCAHAALAEAREGLRRAQQTISALRGER